MWQILSRIILTICFCALFLRPALASVAILSTEVRSQPTGELVMLTLDAPLSKQKLFTLKDPDRVVLDLSTVSPKGLKLPASGASLVKSIRFGQFDTETSRIVLEVNRPIRHASLHQFSDPAKTSYRLVIDIVPGEALAVKESAFPGTQSKPAFTEAHNLKPMIVLDAGHGGKDPGALGVQGTLEKNITLRYTLALQKALLRTGRYRVALTRSNDTFILLHERVAMARKASGDAFISLHADSALHASARGLSVYTVSEQASDEESAALAKQENAVDELAGYKIDGVKQEVADILIELAQRDTKNKSSYLADTMVKHFSRQGIKMLSNTHRFAGFRVLKAPDIPSMLVELGFLSAKEDEAMLKTAAYEQKVIRGIISGLDAYFLKYPVKK